MVFSLSRMARLAESKLWREQVRDCPQTLRLSGQRPLAHACNAQSIPGIITLRVGAFCANGQTGGTRRPGIVAFGPSHPTLLAGLDSPFTRI